MITISEYVWVTDTKTNEKYIMQNRPPYLMARVFSAKAGSGYQATLDESVGNGRTVKVKDFAVYLGFAGSLGTERVRMNEMKTILEDMAEYYLDEVIMPNVRSYRKSAEIDHWRFQNDDKKKEEREVNKMAVAIQSGNEYVGSEEKLGEPEEMTIKRTAYVEGAFWGMTEGVHEAKRFGKGEDE